MISIAVCDDEQVSNALTTEVLSDYIKDKHIEGEVRTFLSASELLQCIEETGPFDIYILDQIMPEIDGMTLAKTLRESNPGGEIIFLSATPDFVFESFAVHPLNYHLKPLNAEELYKTLDDALSRIANDHKLIEVRTNSGDHRINTGEIKYVEHKERRAHYFLSSGRVITSVLLRASFSDQVAELLENDDFTNISSSVIVNLNYVERINSETVILKDNNK